MFSIPNDELDNSLPIGDMVLCKVCDKMHKVKYGDIVKEDGTKEKSNLLAFIKCPENDKCYLVGINGKEFRENG